MENLFVCRSKNPGKRNVIREFYQPSGFYAKSDGFCIFRGIVVVWYNDIYNGFKLDFYIFSGGWHGK